jgi:superfamily II DNA or RNA helicase
LDTSAAGKTERTGCVDVAVIQSLYRQDEVKDFVAEYGQLIVDECHHISAFTFEQVMRQVKAKYVVGLTATPTRKDGHHPIIYMQCGPVRFNMSARCWRLRQIVRLCTRAKLHHFSALVRQFRRAYPGNFSRVPKGWPA